MSIDFRKYVLITSGVGGAATVPQRDLIGRIFSSNILIPPNSILEFTGPTADDVGAYFGTESEEFKRAVFYFGWISPRLAKARKIAFARWNSAAVAPMVFGGSTISTLVNLQAIVAGVLRLTTPAGVVNIAGINFSAAASLNNVAAILQTALRANADPMFAAAVVTYDATVPRFIIQGTTTGNTIMTISQSGAGNTDVGAAMGLYEGDGAIYAPGNVAQTPTAAVLGANALSNNYGSFLFQPDLTIDQHVSVAQYNETQNVSFQYCIKTTTANINAWAAALLGIAGVSLNLDPGVVDEYPEMPTMIQLAATDYSKRNATSNFMFKSFQLTPSVTDTTVSNNLDLLRVNYYGQTQINGVLRSFYQRGVLMGASTAPVDQNVFGNEQWLKDYLTTLWLNALLSLPRIPANDDGRAIGLGIIQDGVDRALFNGVISVGKVLTTLQKQFITEISDNELTWHQVQGLGYWFDLVIVPVVQPSGVTDYVAQYTLIYSKDDTIRKVEGTHSLI